MNGAPTRVVKASPTVYCKTIMPLDGALLGERDFTMQSQKGGDTNPVDQQNRGQAKQAYGESVLVPCNGSGRCPLPQAIDALSFGPCTKTPAASHEAPTYIHCNILYCKDSFIFIFI